MKKQAANTTGELRLCESYIEQIQEVIERNKNDKIFLRKLLTKASNLERLLH